MRTVLKESNGSINRVRFQIVPSIADSFIFLGPHVVLQLTGCTPTSTATGFPSSPKKYWTALDCPSTPTQETIDKE